jgi:type IV secretion system protein VirB8
MTPAAESAKDAYFSEARTWATDRGDSLVASRRIAWWVAIAASIVALALAIVLVMLLPLKTVVPYTLLVDRQTGAVQKLDPIMGERISPDSALTQSFLVQYVIARESFDRATVQTDYRKVALWTADPARQAYVNAMQANNPDSPLVRLRAGTAIETRIRSVSSLGGQTALVRFDTLQRISDGSAQVSQNWVAVVAYRFTQAPMAAEDRFINPLGFQVVRYTRNPEALPVTTPAPPQVQAVPLASPTPATAQPSLSQATNVPSVRGSAQ